MHSANSNQHPPQDKPGVQGWEPAQRKHEEGRGRGWGRGEENRRYPGLVVLECEAFTKAPSYLTEVTMLSQWQGRPRNQYKHALPNLEPHELVRPARTRADESTRAGRRARRRDIASEASEKGSSRTDPSLQC